MDIDKQMIEIKDLPTLRIQLQAKIKAADPVLERIKCVFSYRESPIVYIYTAFDFLDQYEEIIANNGPIEKFYVCQLIEKKSIS